MGQCPPSFHLMSYDSPISQSNQTAAEAVLEHGVERVSGVLELLPDYGFLRRHNLKPAVDDVYISLTQIRKFDLRQGDLIYGQARPPKEGERYWGLLRIDSVNERLPDESRGRPAFENLTPIFPKPKILLETDQKTLSTRIIDLVSPIGFGQRALIVSPPKAGKTWLLKDIAHGIAENYKIINSSNLPNPPDKGEKGDKGKREIQLMVVLIGERPEEVTDMRRSVQGEVVASNFDEPPEEQVKIADVALEKAKRQVELKHNVILLVDSITRLARAHNLTIPPSGRTLSGGFDPAALFGPKHFFGAARNLEEDGSLTIIATCLVDTGSRMDDLIYEEFKGTGNMELHLDRRLSERRVFPSIDITRSGTRREDLLFSEKELEQIFKMRKMVDLLGGGAETTELFLERLRKTKNNQEFLETLHEAK